ncbi:MAG: hypothetical protein IT369_00410 [Candidatus Latescibacteria bacterium]|nr:hypothetical protein [Candidatus Latescibacterota bacterium]
MTLINLLDHIFLNSSCRAPEFGNQPLNDWTEFPIKVTPGPGACLFEGRNEGTMAGPGGSLFRAHLHILLAG